MKENKKFVVVLIRLYGKYGNGKSVSPGFAACV